MTDATVALDETPPASDLLASSARGAGRPPRTAIWTGIGSGFATFVFLLFGVTRAYDLDDSLTIGVFVATPSISDAFTKAYVLNNHVFFSFLEHLVYTSTGSHSEPVMRMLPTVFAAVSVGVLAYLLTERWGVVAGVSGAAVMATNPMFADVGTQVRGYSLLMLCTIVSTALVISAVRRGGASTAIRLVYALVIAVGVATHLYMLVVVAIHGFLTLADRRVTRSWIVPWLGGIVIGSAAYVRVWRPMRQTADELGRNFRPVFPRDLSYALLGGSALAVVLVAILVLPALWNARRDRLVQLGALAVLLAVLGIWVIGPFDLYPRFFLWILPLTALGAAAAVGRRPLLVLLVGAIVVVQLVSAWPRLTEDSIASGTVATVFSRVDQAGGRPCTIDTFASLRLLGYQSQFSLAATRDQMKHCTVAVLLGVAPKSRPARDADATFRYRTLLPARRAAVLWSTVPTRCWLSSPSAADAACAVEPDPVPKGG